VGERSFGARWWRESLGSRMSIARWATRPAAGTLGLLGALSLSGCATTWADAGGAPESQLTDARDDVAIRVDALRLQRDAGWDVGQRGTALAFPDSTDIDAAGTQNWREAMPRLAALMAPSSPSLQPFYVPTLFQSLIGPGGQSLRAVMRPIHGAAAEEDFARGIALRAQFAAVDWPRDTALVVDAPGPRAVAVAAALADHFAPVFMFGNWPHPLGVVPAHQTLAASLYYLPMFSAAAAVRAPDAPPVFVLDANRLAPYGDADKQFDNRYFVKLPTAEQLAALGVRHVLYVGAEPRELDDLNAALVALCQRGVDVKMVALGDFVRAGDEPAALAQRSGSDDAGDGDDSGDGDEAGDGDESGDGDASAALDPAWAWAFAWAHSPFWWPHFWYRGCWWDRGVFWGDYRFYPASHGRGMGVPHRRGPVVVGPPTGTRTPPLPSHAAWTPAARSTMFRPVAGAAHPTFGQVAVTASRSDGHIVGMRGGNESFNGGARAGGGGAHFGSFGGAGHTMFHPGGSAGGFSHASVGRTGFGGFGGGGRSGSLGRAGSTSFGGG